MYVRKYVSMHVRPNVWKYIPWYTEPYSGTIAAAKAIVHHDIHRNNSATSDKSMIMQKELQFKTLSLFCKCRH